MCTDKRVLQSYSGIHLDGKSGLRSMVFMDQTPIIEDAVTIVPVKSVRATVAFYTGVLGFEDRMVSDDGTFAILVHGEAAVHLVQTDDTEALRATAENISIYLWVKHVDALYAALKPKLDELPEGRVRAPFDQPYGMREFHVKDPDGCLLFFGEDNE
jgi:catechol 2,3-dioxygenase-like lactoylglutathione lyase family enzyme